MYVRWTKRERSLRGEPNGKYALSAKLVECVRVDGKPRQRILCYLGTIREEMRASHYHMVDFWTAASANLAKLDLKKKLQSKIEKDLEQVVARPGKRSRARANALLREITRNLSGANR